MKIKVSVIFLLFIACAGAVMGKTDIFHGTQNALDYVTKIEVSLNPEKRAELRNQIEPYIKELDDALKDAPKYIEQKEERMAKLREEIRALGDNPAECLVKEQVLYKEYSGYMYDSMFVCAQRCVELAKRMNNHDQTVKGEVMEARAFMIGGFFRECDGLLQRIDTVGCSDDVIVEYLMLCFDLDFEDGFFLVTTGMPNYFDKSMDELYKCLLHYRSENSVEAVEMRAKKAFHKRDTNNAISEFYKLLDFYDSNSMEYSNAIGNLGYNQMHQTDVVESMHSMTTSAIIAIKHGSRSYPAMRKIVEAMYMVDDLPKAYEYVQISMDNARWFNSRYRIYESTKLFPVLDVKMYDAITKSSREKTIVITSLAVMLVLLLLSGYKMYSQHRKMKAQNRLIEEQNLKLQQKNKQVLEANTAHREANMVRDYSLGELIYSNASLVERVEQLRKNVARKVKVKSYDDIETLIDQFSDYVKNSQQGIDKLVLHLFPNFVKQMNEMFKPDCQQYPESVGTLTPELRICALIRLGVVKNEDLARCLNYSVNTIKSYKTRIKNSLAIERESFEDELAKIKYDDKCRPPEPDVEK